MKQTLGKFTNFHILFKIGQNKLKIVFKIILPISMIRETLNHFWKFVQLIVFCNITKKKTKFPKILTNVLEEANQLSLEDLANDQEHFYYHSSR